MSDAINKKKWMLFVKQAKGLDIAEIRIGREDRGGKAHLKYNAKAPRFGRMVVGEWLVELEGKDAAGVEGEIKAFLDKARKEFFVKREAGLTGEGYRAAQELEGEKAKVPLGPAEEPPAKKA